MKYFQAFLFPFRRENLGVVLVGVVLLCGPAALLGILGNDMPFWRWLQFILLLWLGFGFAMFFRGLIDATCEGEDRFQPWPDDPEMAGLTDRGWNRS